MTVRKKFNGMNYTGHGPFYCPNGTSWKDMEGMIKFSKIAGNSVRVIKKPISENPVNMNTHEVWFYARAWEAIKE